MSPVKAIAIVVIALLVGGAASGADNSRLKQLFDDDQRDRSETRAIDWKLLGQRDLERQRVALELIKSGALTTANDFYHAAMVFQHAASAEDIDLAHSLVTVATRIDPGHTKARWLAAAAWDRALQRRNRPQWYGTQFVLDQKTQKWILYQIDETAVTDEERQRYGVRPLSEVAGILKKLNSE